MSMNDASNKAARAIVVGQQFGRWVILSADIGRTKGGKLLCKCKCVCGVGRIVMAESLRSGTSKSCGCLQREIMRSYSTKHGQAFTSGYNSWSKAKSRCTNPTNKDYSYYGGRGITFCKRWNKFENFYADMGPMPTGHTLERVDNSKGYYPGNVKWATRLEQANNQRSNRMISLHGQSQTLAQWSRHTGLNEATIRRRLQLGWSIEKALAAPSRA